MIALSTSRVAKSFGGHRVLEGASWEIADGAKIGLVGPNGAGKSTLLRILAGVEAPDEGAVTRRRGVTVAYLPQEPDFDPEARVLEVALAADGEVGRLEARLGDLERRMGEPAVYEDGEALARVMEEHAAALEAFERSGGLNYRGRVESTLRDVGFEPADFDLPTRALSGGQRKLLGLAGLLVQRPDVLLLDEPDNHLDLEAKGRLERLVAAHPGAVVIISHDRYLLDVVAETIVEVEQAGRHPGRPQLSVYPGNYSEFAYAKRMQLERQQHDHLIQQREISRLEQSIQRLKVWATAGGNEKFVRRWKSMQKRVDRIERIERPVLEPRRMGLELTAQRGSKKVLEVTGLRRAFGANEVLRGVELLVRHGERVALLGPNGAGKSVLFRIVLGEMRPDAGEVRLGPSITVAYYAQEHETLDPNRTAIEEIRHVRPMHEGAAMAHLGRFLFSHDLATKRVATLSGGEKSRLQMAKLMLREANLLLLDEPTNNLDVTSCEVLEEALEDYPGTLLVISHDRYFLERIAQRVVVLDEGVASEFQGDYATYLAGAQAAVGAR